LQFSFHLRWYQTLASTYWGVGLQYEAAFLCRSPMRSAKWVSEPNNMFFNHIADSHIFLHIIWQCQGTSGWAPNPTIRGCPHGNGYPTVADREQWMRVQRNVGNVPLHRRENNSLTWTGVYASQPSSWMRCVAWKGYSPFGGPRPRKTRNMQNLPPIDYCNSSSWWTCEHVNLVIFCKVVLINANRFLMFNLLYKLWIPIPPKKYKINYIQQNTKNTSLSASIEPAVMASTTLLDSDWSR
jgi:hypothetical protein